MWLLLLTLAGDFPDPWGSAGDRDVSVISHGEIVSFEEHTVDGKFTVVDVGASWCGPCHSAAHQLRDYMDLHPDVAVRVVDLGDNPWESWEQPIVAEELGARAALPYFLLFDPDGDLIYRGNSVSRVVRKMDRKRR